MTLLLPEGDRTCEECNGTGMVVNSLEFDDPRYGYIHEEMVRCPDCEDGRITERQNMRLINLRLSL